MGNITMVDGHVPDGSYQNVTANGSCSCDAGMRFDGLRARGSFDAMRLDGGNVHCEGRLTCRGDMHVNRISGHGELHVGGDLRCSALDFTGKIIVQGDVMCSGGMTVRGLLRNRSCIVTRYLDMQGTLDADELHTERLRMTPLSSAMFGRSGMTEFTRTSNAERIIGGDLRVSRLICTLMQGVFIRLTDESHVERVHYEARHGQHVQRIAGIRRRQACVSAQYVTRTTNPRAMRRFSVGLCGDVIHAGEQQELRVPVGALDR